MGKLRWSRQVLKDFRKEKRVGKNSKNKIL